MKCTKNYTQHQNRAPETVERNLSNNKRLFMPTLGELAARVDQLLMLCTHVPQVLQKCQRNCSKPHKSARKAPVDTLIEVLPHKMR